MFDWFTFFAQLINFLILVALLKHFLFRRIVTAMDERQKRIRLHLEEAESKEKAAQEELQQLQQERKDFALQRDQLFQENREKAENMKSEMVKDARGEVQKAKCQWDEAIEKQKQSFLDDLRTRTGQEIYAIASKVLKDLANENLEHNIINVFITRIDTMNDKKRIEIKNCLSVSHEDILIQSAFDISQSIREEISDTIKKNLGYKKDLKFDTTSQLTYGIELKVNGHKLGWSLENYLDNLQDRLKEAFVKNPKEKS